MSGTGTDISIIVVNYKVKEYIANLLNSIQRAKQGLSLEIFIVDNNSGDDPVSFLRQRFPEVSYIANDENKGFGKANNQAIKQAKGKYTLIINPDTLVSEDTLTILTEHMENNPRCGAAGCKILNPNGSFAPESRRSVPTLWTSLSKISGLNALFPKSRLFGQYYLGWMGEDEPGKVPVLSGSFMFWRTSVLKDLGGFDERFFMYGEDIDLCYRIQETDYHIDYVPEASIIHYKGESSRKGDLKYIRIFNKAMYQFFDKHQSYNYSLLFRVFIFSAIWIRAFFSLIANNLKMIGYLTSDLLVLNISVILGFMIRYQFSYEVLTNIQNLKFLWINLLASVIYILTGSFLNLFRTKKDSVSNQIKAIVASYAGVAVITFFARNIAFSRLALIIGCTIALLLMVLLKLIQINMSKSDSKVTGKLNRLKVIIVGGDEQSEMIRSRIHSRPDLNYEVVGTISMNTKEEAALGSLPQLQDMIHAYKADQVFFALESISYKDMLKQISTLQNENVLFKLIPDSMDFILGKSNVEYLDSIPLVEVDFKYSKGVNRFFKRLMDIKLSLIALIGLFPFVLPLVLFDRSERVEIRGCSFYKEADRKKWRNRFLLFRNILFGKMSLVGSPVYQTGFSEYHLKPGFTGLIQINRERIGSGADMENYALYYLQNYSVWMDIDILLKALYNGSTFSDDLKRAVSNSAA